MIDAEGSVFIAKAGQIWRGEKIRYNLISGTAEAEDFRSGKNPYFVAGKGLSVNLTNQVYSATNTLITSDDYAEPFIKVRARKFQMYSGQYIAAEGATIYLGNVPIMYLPHYRRFMGRHLSNFEFEPGFRSAYGAYVLGTYNYYFSTNLDMALHFDLRSRRGVGGGPDFNYDLGPILGHGQLQTYITRDLEPGATQPVLPPARENRYRVSLFHVAEVDTNTTVRLAVRQQSDPAFMRDYFEGEYRRNPQPSSYLEVSHLWSNWGLNAYAQPQINDYFQTVERLPDIRLTGFRQQVGQTPVFYESETSLAYLRFQPGMTATTNYSAMRWDTYHQVLLPYTFFGWLNVAPRVGERFTYYGATDGKGAQPDEQMRAVFNTGMEVSMKASRSWNNLTNSWLELDGLRHIFEPTINYVFVPSPNKAPANLPQFDHEFTSLRLLPIDYPDYNAIDSVDSQNTLRLGLRNKLQTHRDGRIENLLNWAVVTDWRLKPRSGQSTFADVYSDLDFSPRSWLYFNSQTRYSIDLERWREADHQVVFSPSDRWSWGGGHRYFRSDPALGPDSGNNLITSRLYLKLNENWGVRVSHYFEARDGHMEEQYYTIYRDLRSWTTSLTFRVRDNRRGSQDFTIGFQISLKAFPRFKMGQDAVEPSFLLGG